MTKLREQCRITWALRDQLKSEAADRLYVAMAMDRPFPPQVLRELFTDREQMAILRRACRPFSTWRAQRLNRRLQFKDAEEKSRRYRR